MTEQYDAFLLSSAARENRLWLKVTILVITLHAALFGFAAFWSPTPTPTKPRSPLFVQTLLLSPVSSSCCTESKASPTLESQVLNSENPLSNSTPSPSLEPITPPTPTPSSPAEPLLISESTQEILPPKSTEIPPIPAAPPEKIQTPAPPKPTPRTTPKNAKPTTATPPVPTSPVRPKTETAPSKTHKEKEIEKRRAEEKANTARQREREAEAAREAALLAKAKENLAKIREKRDKGNSPASLNLDSATLPKTLDTLHVDALPTGGAQTTANWTSQEMDYVDQIAYRLKAMLLLPEYGAVQVKLTLGRTGSVSKIEVIHSESNKNKVYAESKIPTLLFPSFGKHFSGATEKTFEITLQNAS